MLFPNFALHNLKDCIFLQVPALVPNIFLSRVIEGYDLDGEYNKKIDLDVKFGIAILVKNSIKIKSKGQVEIYDDHTSILNPDFSNLPVYFQYIELEINGKSYTICNFHGIPKPADKLDSPERINQSKKILDFLTSRIGPRIFVGDFNLLSKTKSIHTLEDIAVNLIKKYNISMTRSKRSPYFGKAGFQKFADYAFVSSEVVIKDFRVPQIEVSDHLPMILDFS